MGTVKRVRRNAADVMEEMRRRKQLERLVAVDQLFTGDAAGEAAEGDGDADADDGADGGDAAGGGAADGDAWEEYEEF